MESTETSMENGPEDNHDPDLMEKLQNASVKSAKTYYEKSHSHQRICGIKANLNAHGDLGYDDGKLLNRKQSATSVIMEKQLGKLKDNDDMVLQGTMDDWTGGILTLTNGTSSVLDVQPNTGQLKDDVNKNRVISLSADVNNNLMAYEDPANQEMDNGEPMANRNQNENDENETNEINKDNNENQQDRDNSLTED